MKITKKEIFVSMLQSFGISTEIKETKKYIKSGKHKYYKESNTIIKESIEVEYIGGKYEKVKKVVVFVVEKTMGAIKLINAESKRVIINFTTLRQECPLIN